MLIVISVLPVQAEQKYFTWVDAQGNVHSTPIQSTDESQSDEARARLNKDAFITEEQSEAERKKHQQDNPAFFTWIDAEGRVRNSVKPEYVVEFESAELVADAVFAPPFRLPIEITQGECCEVYAEAFETAPETIGPKKVDSSSYFYKTRGASVPAAYIKPAINDGWMGLKLYQFNDESTIDLVLLNKEFKPIHLASGLSPLAVEETWSHHGYHKLILELNDEKVEYIIVFSTDFAGKYYSVSLKYDLSEF